MIDVQNLTKKFGKFTALQEVNLTCQAGQCIALLGPNGCGKTTLIKCLLSMVIPTTGSIAINGKEINGDVAYKKQIGYMPQIGRYPDHMTIGQVIQLIENLRPNTDRDEHLLNAFRLPELYGKRMRTLSGGTTQKVSATLAFLFNPAILILDEPTAGLDPLASEILKEKIIAEKEKGKLILITSHLLSELDDMISQIIFMQEGRILLHQDIDTLRASTGEKKISKAIAHLLKKDIGHG